jgi:hypothetical protein
MTDSNTVTVPAEQLQQLLAQAAQRIPVQHPTPAMMPASQMGGMMMQSSAPAMMPAAQMGLSVGAPTGVMVSIRIPLPDGSEAAGYLQLPAEVMANPSMIPQVVMNLAQQWPIKTYQPRNNNFGGNGGYGGSGGYGGNSGYSGYRRNNYRRW